VRVSPILAHLDTRTPWASRDRPAGAAGRLQTKGGNALVFVIGHHLGEDRWEQIGRSSGNDPSAALNDWIELIRVDPGEYGVKDAHEDGWSRFIVEDRGVHRVDRF